MPEVGRRASHPGGGVMNIAAGPLNEGSRYFGVNWDCDIRAIVEKNAAFVVCGAVIPLRIKTVRPCCCRNMFQSKESDIANSAGLPINISVVFKLQ